MASEISFDGAEDFESLWKMLHSSKVPWVVHTTPIYGLGLDWLPWPFHEAPEDSHHPISSLI